MAETTQAAVQAAPDPLLAELAAHRAKETDLQQRIRSRAAELREEAQSLRAQADQKDVAAEWLVAGLKPPEPKPEEPAKPPRAGNGVVQAAVLAHVLEHPSSIFSAARVAQELGLNPDSVGAAFRELNKRGVVTKVGRHWQAAAEPKAPAPVQAAADLQRQREEHEEAEALAPAFLEDGGL